MSVEMGQLQSQMFAQEIFEDIDAYIESHQEEFEAFLQAELNEVGGVNYDVA